MNSFKGLRTTGGDTIEWRRSKVLELNSQGYGQREIASILQIGKSTINRDIMAIRQQAKLNIRKYIDEWLPEEYEKCLVGLNSIVKEAWSTSQQTQDSREKIQALSLAKECYAMKLELLTNATVVDDAIRFVSGHGRSVATVSLGGEVAAIKSKINTAERIQESECTNYSPSTTTNQTF